MNKKTNGINMLDVKKNNRSSIIWTVYYANGISRKEIAARLGLTPAAITLITTNLISEGILIESSDSQSSGHKGRKEVLLTVNKKAFGAIGVYISKKYFRVACTDLDCNILFEETVHTADCHGKSDTILKKVIHILHTDIKEYDIPRTIKLLGIGVCVHGIVDTSNGISVNSYGIWEENAPVSSVLEEAFGIPVILVNNICALAHGEAFLMRNTHPDDMLFIKYGPGVGAARLNSNSSRSIYNYSAVELGHIVMDPNGSPCICGSQGCLETIAGYSAIEQSISQLINDNSSPILSHLTHSNTINLTMSMVMEAYSRSEKIAMTAITRAIFYLALAIRNSVCLFKPKKVILYGELFENMKFRDELNRELASFNIKASVSYSRYNMKLPAIGPATTIIGQFFEESDSFSSLF